MDRPYRILIADDHAVVRRGVRALIESQPGLEICREVGTGADAIEFTKLDKPDLLLLDLTMPEANGLDVTRTVRQESPVTAVVVLTAHFSEELAREVLNAGAIGYVLKSDAETELLSAISRVRQNKPFFTNQLTESMTENFLQNPSDENTPHRPLSGSPLTTREIEVIQLLAQGKSNREAGAELGLSTRTIESHRHHIMHKMNFASFSDLVRFAVRNNLVEL